MNDPWKMAILSRRLASVCLCFYNAVSSGGDMDMIVFAIKVDGDLSIIDRLAVILKKYSTYKIIIEGHALNLYWNDPARAAKEEKLLINLSTERAENVKQALVERGIDPGCIATRGKGSLQPFIPSCDTNNQWKNRGVEITLLKN